MTAAMGNHTFGNFSNLLWYLMTAPPFVLPTKPTMQEIYAVAGYKASIPCNLTYPSAGDSISLILWYKGENKVPIYTVDSRKGPLQMARHFPSAELATRANINTASTTPALILNPVHEEDDGVYICRIEFKRSRTLSQLVKLHVIAEEQDSWRAILKIV